MNVEVICRTGLTDAGADPEKSSHRMAMYLFIITPDLLFLFLGEYCRFCGRSAKARFGSLTEVNCDIGVDRIC